MMKKKHIKTVLAIVLAMGMGGCAKEEAFPVVADFKATIANDDISVPVEVAIVNSSEGADNYRWSFEGGSPSSSQDKNPGAITYDKPGTYTIRLTATNRDGSTDTKELTLVLITAVEIGFTTEILESNYSPVEVKLTNTTQGANTYHWTFEGGTPVSSDMQHPENVVFTEPGEHTITLEAGNGQDTYQEQKTITVAPYLEAAFDMEVAFEDDDHQVPVSVSLIDNSTSATGHHWTFESGTPATSAEENPVVVFNTPGTHTITLEATNGKETKTISKTVTVYQNRNLRTFENIKLGINTAHSSNHIGAFFSSTTRRVYNRDQVTDENGPLIDIVYFGLNGNFTYNRFVSPDRAEELTFEPIPGAAHTKVINLQESCGCPASLSAGEFDAMSNGSILSGLTIEDTNAGMQDFDDSVVPRIVLFQTGDGRKGAVKVKEFVRDGQQSYIIVDIKVQKQGS
ncbi:PKD domain-containing protein [Galbibacter sp. EGI 63066]|uniref:PKD domain-containing protein n=1 Tax=Galbibacter sp. EGI 63066 TaxID=2993559 RepID=UPI0022489C00|nr:PKD domain-containing protein [Galbibacter sp. EGI 63066]MCX2682109.1 PKD domain-containing protein [Galbibacter sp. EGI 63066]